MCRLTPSIVALIPARAGSKRLPHKNTKEFFGHPLIAYTIHAAKDSRIFREIVVSTDDDRAMLLAIQSGVRVIKRRPEDATDDAPDIRWVSHVLETRYDGPDRPDAFAILRPTSPFRTAETIQRAWTAFQEKQPCDSLRAVELARQNPHKMWIFNGTYIIPAFHGVHDDRDHLVPWHSCPTQTLPQYCIQNASLEIAWTRCVTQEASISGALVVPFATEGYEGFDLNTPDDWTLATSLVDRGLVALPTLAPQTATAPQK